MRGNAKSLMALAMVVSVSVPTAVLSGYGAASGNKARDNVGATNTQTGTAAVNQAGSGVEVGIGTNTDASTDIGTGSGTGGNGFSGKKIVIEYWHCNAETQGGLVVDELVKQFNESDDHTQVVARYNPDMYKELVQNLQTEAVVGDSPALVQVGWTFLDYSSNNLPCASPQEAIDRFDKEGAGFPQDKSLPDVLELAVNSQGSRMGIPYSLSNPVLYINKDILREAGLAEDDLTTWQGVNELAKTIKERAGKYDFHMQEPADFWAQQGLIESSDTKMLTTNAEGKKEASFATGDGIEAMQLTTNIVEDQTVLCTSWERGCQSFINGNCVMLYTIITREASMQKGVQFDVVTVEPPLWKGKRRMVPAGGYSLTITAQGDDQIEAVWESKELLYSVKSTVAWTEGTDYVPPRENVAGTENGLKIFLIENKMMNAAIQQMDEVIPWAAFPGDAGLQAEQMLLNMRDQIPGEQVMAEQGVKAAQDVINQLLAVQ